MTPDELARKLRENFSPAQCEKFIGSCAKGLAAELRRRTVLKTPIGNYSGDPYICESGLSHKGRKVKDKSRSDGGVRRGGTLRKSWHTSSLVRSGNKYIVNIKNTALSDRGIPYGLYVELGTRKHPDLGHKMLTKSVNEVQAAAHGYLERKLNRKLRDVLK